MGFVVVCVVVEEYVTFRQSPSLSVGGPSQSQFCRVELRYVRRCETIKPVRESQHSIILEGCLERYKQLCSDMSKEQGSTRR